MKLNPQVLLLWYLISLVLEVGAGFAVMRVAFNWMSLPSWVMNLAGLLTLVVGLFVVWYLFHKTVNAIVNYFRSSK